MTPFAVSGLLISLTCFPLAWLILLKAPRTTPNNLMALFNVCVGIWGLGTMLAGLAQTSESALWSWKLAHVGGVFLGMVFYHLSCVLSGLHRPRMIRFAYLLATAFVGSCVTGLAMFETQWLFGSLHYHRAHALYTVYVVTWVSIVVLGHRQLFLAYRRAEGTMRTRLKLAFQALMIGFIGGTSVLLPMFGVHLYPYGNFSIPIYSAIVTYAIVKHQLLDIQVVIRKSLVYSLLVTCITALYLVMVLIMEKWFQGFMGYRSFVATVGAALLIAIFFDPLRHRIQTFVDRALLHGTPAELAVQREHLLTEVRKSDHMKAIAVLASGLAHEIKNPLASLKTFAAYLPEKSTDPVFQQKFQRILTVELDRIDQIVHRLLNFAKPASSHREILLISQLLDDTLDFLSNECLRRHIEVQRFYDSNDTIHADPQQLRQAFLNLFLNSLEAMEEGGVLTVSTSQQNDHLTVEIQDTGKGIPAEHRNHLFDPFFTTKPNGTGLGLSIVRGIVTEHGGTITFESEAHRGTQCTLTFPLSESREEQTQQVAPV